MEQDKDILRHVAQAFRQQVARHIRGSGIDYQNMMKGLESENLDPQVKELFNKAMERHARDRTLA